MSPLLTRRTILRGLASSAVALGAGACATSSIPVDAPRHVALARRAGQLARSTGPLRILHPDGCEGNLEPIARAFQRLSGVRIELVKARLDEISAEVLLAHTVSSEPAFDVAIPATFAIPDLVEAGTLAPLDAIEQAHADLLPAARSLFTLGDRYKARLYGYQTDGDVYTMFYLADWLGDPTNRARYADAHGRELAIPRTFAELEKQLAFFHDPAAGRYGGSLFRNVQYIGWEFWARLHANGIYPVGDGLVPRFDTPEALDALEGLVRCGRWLEPGAADHGLFENFSSYSDGTKFCNVGWGGTQKHLTRLESPVRGRVTHGMLPGGVLAGEEVPMPYFNWGWNYVVSARCPDVELAWLFIAFATTPHVSTEAVRQASGYFDPFLAEHYDDPAIEAVYGRSFLDVHRQSMQAAIPDFYVQGQGRYMLALKHAVHGAAHGVLTPSKALAALQERWSTLTDELGRNSQALQWSLVQQSYPEHLKRSLR